MTGAILTIGYWILFNQIDREYRFSNGIWAFIASTAVILLLPEAAFK